jgi:hypothetical protein
MIFGRFNTFTVTAAFLGAALMSIAGCVGTEVGNPQEDASVSVEFKGVEQPRPSALTLSSGVRIDEAWLVFSESSVELASSCDEDDEIDVDQPFVVELVSGSELPTPNMFTRPRANYCRFELEVAALTVDELPAGVPDDLDATSLWVRGARADGTPFVLRSQVETTIELAGDIALTGDRESLIVAFAVDRWFEDAGLDAAEGTDEIAIDDENNVDVLEAVNGNIAGSALLLRDSNDDGAAQASELAAPIADSADDE